MLASWVEAGLQPDSFWEQTPATFDAIMRGAMARIKADMRGRVADAWNNAAFTAAASAGKLRPLNTYLDPPKRIEGAGVLDGVRRLKAQTVEASA